MGLQEIKSEILEDARQKAEEIREEAEKEAEEIISDAEQKAEQIREKEEKKLEEQKETYRKKTLSNARMKAKEERMKAKEEKIDEVFDNFHEYLEDLSSTDKEQFVERCLEKVEFEVGKIQGSPEFKDSVGKEFEEKDIEGIIVISEDGERKQSFTFDKIAENYREEFRREVAELLF